MEIAKVTGYDRTHKDFPGSTFRNMATSWNDLLYVFQFLSPKDIDFINK